MNRQKTWLIEVGQLATSIDDVLCEMIYMNRAKVTCLCSIFRIIEEATTNFLTVQLFGEGGFSPRYKGVLEGQEIASKKRLFPEFRPKHGRVQNEVILIASCSTESGQALELLHPKGRQDAGLRIHALIEA
ncbi:hypothetical protein HPP92_015633 [Vanilla planifolia]|uniref:Uncharacterized protein n=1 Tax=Vanilla planifolia TaxID=51239 RepID=A0A835QNR3_VANPL|nr:hypothetical protein HPP92_016331 [Vanilla planifolia]KAG0471087.1 hypothetical protein HPP92_015633 [Vanilla planifolia]